MSCTWMIKVLAGGKLAFYCPFSFYKIIIEELQGAKTNLSQ